MASKKTLIFNLRGRVFLRKITATLLYLKISYQLTFICRQTDDDPSADMFLEEIIIQPAKVASAYCRKRTLESATI